MRKPDAVFVTFIAATPQAVWDLLTDKARSPQFFFGYVMSVGGAAGEPFTVTRADGTPDVAGKVLVHEPPHRLRVSWDMVAMPDVPTAELEFLLEPVDDVVRLTIRQFDGGPISDSFVEAGREGWSLIQASLKTLLETGRPLPPIKPRPPQ
ncbi:uncharacterized protein YndB with AHSA1/START domain [Caulobacter ginsengisoli]|uniref:Uncharacterized protein YndB with AHSA1/START domain n=1 Tax=Caulobacter ginsengisoli TaxID=400775 RepID=A0ABU0IV67_9CAUL|nr:SRPBCC domain-containing protein [Caulobacter ginsengisoli]MDQ0465910.1 uncharacterized protein YndB with AHSA1/START domain [Caulobacter ginsengisoli]